MACNDCQAKIDQLEKTAYQYRELASAEFAKARDPEYAGYKGQGHEKHFSQGRYYGDRASEYMNEAYEVRRACEGR